MYCDKEYVEGVLNAELPKWALNAEIKPKIKDNVLCFAFERGT